MYAFKIAGNRGGYDVVADFNLDEYYRSLPFKRKEIKNIQEFKDYEAQYFTPSDLISGLERKKQNIKNIQAIIFDLDGVDHVSDLISDAMVVAETNMEFALWQTPSSLSNQGEHVSGMRLFVPLEEPIEPKLLSQAVDEVVRALAVFGLNVLSYGADLVASKTVGRLMGLPLQQYRTLRVGGKDSWRYKITSQYVEPPHREFKRKRTAMKTAPDEFIKGYMRKHNIDDPTLGVNVHNTLQQLIGAMSKAGFSKDETKEGLEMFEGITRNGMADIEHEVETSSAYKVN